VDDLVSWMGVTDDLDDHMQEGDTGEIEPVCGEMGVYRPLKLKALVTSIREEDMEIQQENSMHEPAISCACPAWHHGPMGHH